MGKKNNGGERMNQHEKSAYLREQAKKYGIDKRSYQDDEGNDMSGRIDRFLGHNYEEGVINAMQNDYKLQESIKYGKESGDKRFANIGSSISNINEAVAAGKAVESYGKDVLGQKNTSSDNDFGNIAESLFKASRQKLTDSMTANEQQDQAERGTTEPVISDELQGARDTVDELENKDYDIFGANIDNGDNQNQRDQASQAFLGKYKLDLKKEKNFSPVLPS